MHLSRYLKSYPCQDRPDHYLLFSTKRSSIAIIPGATLRAAQNGADLGKDAATLKELGFMVDDPEQEREEMRSLIERVNRRFRKFSAVAVLNLDCNLDCGYCYEGAFRHGHYMSPATADLFVETMLRDHISQGHELAVTFYGGEALLSQDLIRVISLPLLEGAKVQGTRYGFNLVTNGTLLTRETVQQLLPLGLQGARVTLDGPREIHDRQRPFASGSGSFDAIIDNIKNVCDLIPIQIGGNYRQDNYREYPRLLDHLLDCGLTPDKLGQVRFTPVVNTASCNSSGCASSSEPWLIEATLFLHQEILRRGFTTSKLQIGACVVEFENHLVVNWDGALYKCPAFMGDATLSVGSLKEGIKEYAESHALGVWNNDACLDCSYLPLCFGGCKYMNQLEGKSLAEVDCRKEFLDATLERHLLQDLGKS